VASFLSRQRLCLIEQKQGAGRKTARALTLSRGVIEVTEFQMHLRWLAEQRRLHDLEQRWREAERQALRELYLSLEDDDQDCEEGESEGESED